MVYWPNHNLIAQFGQILNMKHVVCGLVNSTVDGPWFESEDFSREHIVHV